MTTLEGVQPVLQEREGGQAFFSGGYSRGVGRTAGGNAKDQ